MPKLCFALFALALLAAPLAAQERQLDADKDGDGAVSRAEYLARGMARFASMDANKDLKLTIDERMTQRGPRTGLPPIDRNAPVRPGGVDADGDGFVSMAEYYFNLGTIFARTDSNGDGKIAGEEIAASEARMRPPAPAPQK